MPTFQKPSKFVDINDVKDFDGGVDLSKKKLEINEEDSMDFEKFFEMKKSDEKEEDEDDDEANDFIDFDAISREKKKNDPE